MKKYAVIPSARFQELTQIYTIINQVVDKIGNLVGWTLLECYFTPEKEAEVAALGGQVFEDGSGYVEWKSQFDIVEDMM